MVKRYRRYYSIRQQWALAVTFTIFLALLFFEPPNGDLNTLIPFAASFAIELLCFAFFAWRLREYRMITPKGQFWKEGKVRMVVVCMVLTLLDSLVYIILEQQAQHSDAQVDTE